MDGAGWRWVHALVIPLNKHLGRSSNISANDLEHVAPISQIFAYI